jgi:hypothetical protein
MSKTSQIEIKQEAYLPYSFKLVGLTISLISFTFIGVIISSSGTFDLLLGLKVLGLAVLAISGLILLTAHYRLLIEPNKRSYLVYVWVLGFKSGKSEYFNYIEKIYINGVKLSSRKTSYSGHVVDHKDYVYKAFMKLDNGEKIHLDTDHDREKLDKRVNTYITQLGSLYKANN